MSASCAAPANLRPSNALKPDRLIHLRFSPDASNFALKYLSARTCGSLEHAASFCNFCRIVEKLPKNCSSGIIPCAQDQVPCSAHVCTAGNSARTKLGDDETLILETMNSWYVQAILPIRQDPSPKRIVIFCGNSLLMQRMARPMLCFT